LIATVAGASTTQSLTVSAILTTIYYPLLKEINELLNKTRDKDQPAQANGDSHE